MHCLLRYKGANVTDKGEEAQKRLDKAIKTMVKMGNRKIKVTYLDHDQDHQNNGQDG